MDRVEVYYNKRTRKYSVRNLTCNSRVYSADRIDLKDVTFAVQPAGREKVRRTKQKNVHAFVRGYLIREKCKYGWMDVVVEPMPEMKTRVGYNPYYDDNFKVIRTQKEIFKAPYAILDSEGIRIP